MPRRLRGRVRAIYADLKRIAAAELRRNPGATLNTTALVHEAYAKLAAHHAGPLASRAHFYSLAGARHAADPGRPGAAAPGREARRRRSTDLEAAYAQADARAEELLLIHDALERLAQRDERPPRSGVALLRRLHLPEIAAELGLSERTVRADWALARGVLARDFGVAACRSDDRNA